MRIWGHVLVGATLALIAPLGIESAAGASPSHPGGVPDTCPEVLAGAPTGGVDKSTDPPPGSVVARGAVVEVTLRWDRERFAEPVLHKVLDCVTADGHPLDDLSIQEREPVNDGEFTARVTVPRGLADGSALCDRGFVSGSRPNGQFAREKSNDVCFTVRGDIAEAGPDVSAAPVTPLAAPPPDDIGTAPPPSDAAPSPVPASPSPSPVIWSPSAALADTVTTPPAELGADRAGGGPSGTDIAAAGDRRDQRTTLPRTGTELAPTLVVAMLLVVSGQLARSGGRRRPTT